MRVLHTADWHLGKNLEGKSRLEEQTLFVEDFIKIVNENQVDLVIIAGDVFDNSNPPAEAESLFYNALKRISSDGERLTLVIAGNHDSSERLVSASPIAALHGVIMVGTPKSIIPVGSYGQHKVIDSGEGFIEVEINSEKAVILTVPYPSEKRLNEVIYNDMDSDFERNVSYSDKIKELFENLSTHFRDDTINIAVSHLFAIGSEEGGSERGIELGGSYIVNKECFPKEAQYIALGHIHKPQIVPGTDKKVRYSGSILQYNKKEAGSRKIVNIVDLKANEECIIKEVELKCYKPIEIWKCDSIEEAIKMCEEHKDEESYVYLEISSDRIILDDEIKTMKKTKDDIIEIIHAQNKEEEQESDYSIENKSFIEIFKDFYKKEKGIAPDDEIVDLLIKITDGGEL